MIVHIITSLDKGGAEGVLTRLLTEPKLSEEAVVVVLKQGGYWTPFLRQNGIVVHELKFTSLMSALHSLWLCRLLIKNLNPKLMVSWLYHADFLTVLLRLMLVRTPIIWNLRQTDLHPKKSSQSTRLIFRFNALVSNIVPRQIVCCADAVERFHVRQGYCAAKMCVIPNGFHVPDFDRSKNYSKSRFKIGMAARFDGQKDHKTLLNAVHQFKKNVTDDCELILAGKGIEASNAQLMQWVRELGLDKHVTLLGQVDNMTAFYSELDLHCLVSAFGEGFPNVVAESMAHGVPNVSSDSGEVDKIIGDSGILVPIGDCAALINAMKIMYQEWSTELYHKRQARAKAIISSQYSIERMRTLYGEIFDKY